MADIVKQILAKPIQLADQVTKAADEASSFKQECAELKSKTGKLVGLLRQAARTSSDLYERPTRRIIDDTEQVLEKALSLVLKCRANGFMKRVFTIIPAAAFLKMSSQLENSIGDVSWLLRVSASGDDRDDEYLGLPPIAANEPILCLIWEQIAILYTGSLDNRSDAALRLFHWPETMIEGKIEGQENAAKAIGLLGKDPESVEYMIHAGVCTVFAKILKEGSMKVQAVTAHLAFETIQEHSKYAIASNKATSIHAVVMTNTNIATVKVAVDEDHQSPILHPMGNQNPNQMHTVVTNTMAMNGGAKLPQKLNNNHFRSNSLGNVKQLHHVYYQPQQSGANMKGRELEDPATKSYMKAMAARALWHLAKGNSSICRSITESRALLCFAVLLEKGTDDVCFNSAMALMEITTVAEQDTDLRRSAFKPNSHACKLVVDQLLKTMVKADSELLIPCIKAIGNLARTFKATETRMIAPLVKLLDEREAEVSKEAAVALTKFACTDNYLHLDHSKAIISTGGAKHLFQLVYFGEQIVQLSALVLLCYIALHVPDSEELAQAEVLTVLEWAAKKSYPTQDETIDTLLQEAKSRLELYQSRGSRGFH
ncbi:chaperone protein dnaJ 11 [Hibiscus syriacus]|uniref:Chaperone protein dnaJ 11 n=1 Tax=Hibiscus syriacus TaxID=106335 RepID=A0A6A3D5M7_HIBSY|nr:chaperone protein dnaJ 11 [Hibiscus syriacus]